MRAGAGLENLLDQRPEVASRLRGLARGYLDGAHSPWGVEARRVELDDLELNQLRALGYALE